MQPWSGCIDNLHSTGMLSTHKALAADWCNKRCAMYYRTFVIMHVKDPQPSAVRVGHHVLVAGLSVPIFTLKKTRWN